MCFDARQDGDTLSPPPHLFCQDLRQTPQLKAEQEHEIAPALEYYYYHRRRHHHQNDRHQHQNNNNKNCNLGLVSVVADGSSHKRRRTVFGIGTRSDRDAQGSGAFVVFVIGRQRRRRKMVEPKQSASQFALVDRESVETTSELVAEFDVSQSQPWLSIRCSIQECSIVCRSRRKIPRTENQPRFANPTFLRLSFPPCLLVGPTALQPKGLPNGQAREWW